MEPLSQILSDVYVSGTVFGHARFHGDWSVFTRGASFAIFHAILHGEACIVWADGRRSQPLAEGSVVVVPRGVAHVMCANADVETEPIWIGDVFGNDDDEMVSRAEAGSGDLRTSIICGTFRFDERTPNPLLQALPDVVYVPGGQQDGWVEKTLRWIGAEIESQRPGSDVLVTRLTDTLFVYIVRACLEQATLSERPWLAGLGDTHVSRALAAIHNEPGKPWTAASLARTAGMSRSAFYTRFSELVGATPAHYLASRRMHLAAHALRTEGRTVSEVASSVGYQSESSFSKAFKRAYGVSPSEFRSNQAAAR